MTHTDLSTILALPAAEREQAIEKNRKAIEAVLAEVCGWTGDGIAQRDKEGRVLTRHWIPEDWSPLTDLSQAAGVTEKLTEQGWYYRSGSTANGQHYFTISRLWEIGPDNLLDEPVTFTVYHPNRATAEALAGALAALRGSEG